LGRPASARRARARWGLLIGKALGGDYAAHRQALAVIFGKYGIRPSAAFLRDSRPVGIRTAGGCFRGAFADDRAEARR
jgi:hypothetical protein